MTGNALSGNIRLLDQPVDYRQAAWLGWRDAEKGMPYPRAYDGWSPSQQLAYESARLIFANISVAALRLPLWRKPGDRAGAMWIDNAARAARLKVGEAVPPALERRA